MIEIGGEPVALGQLLFERGKGLGYDLSGGTADTTHEVMVVRMPVKLVLHLALAKICPRDETEIGQEFEIAIHHRFVEGGVRSARPLQDLVSSDVLGALG